MGAPKGNKNAQKDRVWRRTLEGELDRYCDGDVTRGTALQRIAKRTIADALNGDHNARSEIACRLDGKPSEHVTGTFTHNLVQELSDEELASIAAGSRTGAAEAQDGEPEPGPVH